MRPLSRWMRGTTTLVLLGVLMRLLPSAEAAQGTQRFQDGWAVGDQGQITGGQLLSDEVGLHAAGRAPAGCASTSASVSALATGRLSAAMGRQRCRRMTRCSTYQQNATY